MPDTVPAGDHPEVAVPRILCDAHAVTSSPSGAGGALWKLAEPGRQRPGLQIRSLRPPR